MHFIRVETAQVAAAIVLMQENQLCSNLSTFYCTGGGAHKFGALIEEALGVQLHACSELGTVVLGICFMTCMVDDECFTYDYVADTAAPQPPGADTSQRTIVQAVRPSRDSQRRPSIVSDSGSSGDVQRIPFSLNSRSADFFPFLLCNVGTGCSILQVHSETRWERISGTALGGGTFLGLCRRLTEARGFAEAVAMAERGDARKVDMLVRDIYGDGDKQSGLNLPGDLTASFFARNLGAPGRIASDDADICKALDVMVAQNVAQIAHLNAQVHGLKRVFFTGNFLRGNELASKTIVYTMRRLPRLPGASASTEAVFFKHEGYFGAIGAFLEQLA
jgi:type II pantothenate kinase